MYLQIPIFMNIYFYYLDLDLEWILWSITCNNYVYIPWGVVVDAKFYEQPQYVYVPSLVQKYLLIVSWLFWI